MKTASYIYETSAGRSVALAELTGSTMGHD